jgi:hypothetical protein
MVILSKIISIETDLKFITFNSNHYATSSETNNGYIQSTSTCARRESNHRKLIQGFEQVFRAKTADSGL